MPENDADAIGVIGKNEQKLQRIAEQAVGAVQYQSINDVETAKNVATGMLQGPVDTLEGVAKSADRAAGAVVDASKKIDHGFQALENAMKHPGDLLHKLAGYAPRAVQDLGRGR